MGTESKPLDPAIREALSGISTATLTTVLLKKGLRNVWMRGTMPIAQGQPRIVGRAFTLRFVPAREDLATPESWSSPISTRAAIEAMPEGCVAVVDAMGVTDAGIFGDILCARMKKRGIAALVTDGVVRDLAGVLGTGLPVWCRGAAADGLLPVDEGEAGHRGRRRGVSQRRRGGRPGRRGADPGRIAGRGGGAFGGAGAARRLDHGTDRPGNAVAGTVSAECGKQGEVRGVQGGRARLMNQSPEPGDAAGRAHTACKPRCSSKEPA